ncbi:MAG: ATP-binding cassette domain-containing protein [Lachnospiraceae bacterium]|nr:ATP-binding cassette domain-containing protein [Lachnospiraceae bacterium]MCI9110136.1 ATP-binding cassette domain-containing protein [Lachnospiraceae bacterium]
MVRLKESFFAVRREHVSYAYDKRSDSENPISEKNVLNDVSLSIKPGQTVALVGSSGSGKTTVSRLAARIKWLCFQTVLLRNRERRKN